MERIYVCLYCDHKFSPNGHWRDLAFNCPICGDSNLRELKQTETTGNVYGYPEDED